MDKVLIIKPKYRTFPVGFAYVLACLESNNIPFDFIDTDLDLDYKRYLKNNDYIAVATGGLIGQFSFFRDVVINVRKIRPDLPIILGGSITKDIRSDFLIDKIGIDYGVVGEAETSLPYLINAIAKKNSEVTDIPGLIFRDEFGGNIVKNAPRRLDLKSINILPAWHHIDVDYYSQDCYLPFWGNHSAMPILSGRGCVGKCTFCSPTIGSFRMRPIEHVIEEIEIINSSYNFDWIVFFNEMFYPSKRQILEFCEAYKSVKQQKPWVCALRVDADVDVDTFIAMKKAGCVSTSAGIESGSDKVLSFMRKRSTNETIRKFFQNARDARLPCNGTFMVGNEGETEEDLRQTIDMVINEEMNTGESLTLAYPGTQIYKNALKRGLIEDEWNYLRQLRFSSGLWEYEWVDRKNYLNISEIPDECFWNVLVKELRRYHTSLFNRFQAKEVKHNRVFSGMMLKVQGVCCECGNSIGLRVRHSFLGIEDYCSRCFNKVIFNLYNLQDFSNQFLFICKELEKTSKLVIFGTGTNASNLLRIDYFGLNYDKIMGFLEVKPQTSSSLFISMPRLIFADLPSIKPDTILVADDPLSDAELLLRVYYLKEGLICPKIIHLTPSSEKLSLRLINKVCKIAERRPCIVLLSIYQILMPLIKLGSLSKIGVFNMLKYIYNQSKRFKKFRSISHKWKRWMY